MAIQIIVVMLSFF